MILKVTEIELLRLYEYKSEIVSIVTEDWFKNNEWTNELRIEVYKYPLTNIKVYRKGYYGTYENIKYELIVVKEHIGKLSFIELDIDEIHTYVKNIYPKSWRMQQFEIYDILRQIDSRESYRGDHSGVILEYFQYCENKFHIDHDSPER